MNDLAPMPSTRPASPHFSSGPCRKRPGWTLDALHGAVLGRSHRSREGKAKLREVIDLTREVLEIPEDYRIAIVPGSDTGAVEMALWSLLGPRGVDVFAWDSFGEEWVTDIVKQLKIEDSRVFRARYGELPDLSQADSARDIVFTWNGTTAGVRVPDADWIAGDRTGLTICDATSAAFAMDLPWDKLDVTTWSWQKVLGGEGAHGVIVMSPRAIARLTDHTPAWPMPKLYRMVSQGLVTEGLFVGETINTPSLLAVEDAIDGLQWARALGGLPVLKARCKRNFEVVAAWVAHNDWCGFLAARPEIRSPTSICLKIVAPELAGDSELQAKIVKAVVAKLDDHKAALDVGAYRTAPPGFRFWAGATVEADDLKLALEWLDWAYHQVLTDMAG
ncbi:phosphoserine aminotransferase [Rhodoblastus sphagnicola]|uniref:phosphoserine transaminase n=1 Tax=Rhodoblastus sphagnicola TaxID=333368 RepID=A0A2S6NHA0_9HYPH|nr:phosphoserine transaminase [Rhodoblastus sphagnicola]MBB4200868.1 phosphoserine aminotransferase [Rhodoblastus sphagnicola]PPQ33983.1 phosphoserine aminotransferase [Rhodoblastus sphagnicola]